MFSDTCCGLIILIRIAYLLPTPPILERTTAAVFTWTAGHTVEMAVSQYEVLSSASGFETYYDVSDLIVAARESAEEVDAKRAAVFVHLHRDGVRPLDALASYPLHLLQQEVHRHDVILGTACGSRPHTGDALQVLPVTHKTYISKREFVCGGGLGITDAGTMRSCSLLTGFTSYGSALLPHLIKDLRPRRPASRVNPGIPQF